MTGATLVPEATLTSRERVARALRDGGRARVTVKSRASGKHLTVRLACKKRGADGRLISRARKEGRVGFADADVMFADAADAACGDLAAYLNCQTGEWHDREMDDPRGPHYTWAARHVLAWALDGDPLFEKQAEVALASECCVCGKQLTTPTSIERGIGPECFGKATSDQHV